MSRSTHNPSQTPNKGAQNVKQKHYAAKIIHK